MKNILYSAFMFFFCSSLLSCSKDEDIIEINSISGYYYFINETEKDTILYESGKENILNAKIGDELRLQYNPSYKDDLSYKCRMTFVLPDGSSHAVDGVMNREISYSYKLASATPGRKTFLIVPELTEKNVICTVGDKIVIFKLQVNE